MVISFKSENGSCPQFIHEDTRFFIKDEKVEGKESYKYFLVESDLRKKSEKLESWQAAIDQMTAIEEVRMIYRSNDGETWKGKNNDYIIKRIDSSQVTITVRKSNIILSQKFDKYGDCLEFSKKLIEKRLSKLGQISIFSEYELNAFGRH